MQKKSRANLRAAATMAVLMSTSSVALAQSPPPCLSGPPGQAWQEGDPYDA